MFTVDRNIFNRRLKIKAPEQEEVVTEWLSDSGTRELAVEMLSATIELLEGVEDSEDFMDELMLVLDAMEGY